ncbi:uncharacterized protein [Palaemon carinicauda]|uniref:uncharacterized protein n=1 Tax=Palaemon carinicauda TaxID=392227 RepID=UPI0035B5A170
MAAQSQVLRTRYIQRATSRTNISSKCRKCMAKEETINPIPVSGHCLFRINITNDMIHWCLCRKYQIQFSNKCYEHQPEVVVKNDQAKLFWDYSIRTDRVIRAHRSDVNLVEKTTKNISLIDVAVPWDSRMEDNGRDKIEKYHDLRKELRRLWNMQVKVVLIITGMLDTISTSLKENLEKVEANMALGLV